jgi:hypothetical protein
VLGCSPRKRTAANPESILVNTGGGFRIETEAADVDADGDLCSEALPVGRGEIDYGGDQRYG